MKRIDDHQEPIDCYAGQCKRTDVHADALGVGHQVAKGLTENPTAQEGVQRSEGYG